VIAAINVAELGLREGKDERYIGTIFAKQQNGFDVNITKNGMQGYKLKTDLYPHLLPPK